MMPTTPISTLNKSTAPPSSSPRLPPSAADEMRRLKAHNEALQRQLQLKDQGLERLRQTVQERALKEPPCHVRTMKCQSSCSGPDASLLDFGLVGARRRGRQKLLVGGGNDKGEVHDVLQGEGCEQEDAASGPPLSVAQPVQPPSARCVAKTTPTRTLRPVRGGCLCCGCPAAPAEGRRDYPEG